MRYVAGLASVAERVVLSSARRTETTDATSFAPAAGAPIVPTSAPAPVSSTASTAASFGVSALEASIRADELFSMRERAARLSASSTGCANPKPYKKLRSLSLSSRDSSGSDPDELLDFGDFLEGNDHGFATFSDTV